MSPVTASSKLTDMILDVMLTNGIVDAAAVDDIQDEHQRTGKSIRDVLIDSGYIAEDDLLGMLGAHYDYEVVNLAAADITPEIAASIKGTVARM